MLPIDNIRNPQKLWITRDGQVGTVLNLSG
jgi:hypothetical protein